MLLGSGGFLFSVGLLVVANIDGDLSDFGFGLIESLGSGVSQVLECINLRGMVVDLNLQVVNDLLVGGDVGLIDFVGLLLIVVNL